MHDNPGCRVPVLKWNISPAISLINWIEKICHCKTVGLTHGHMDSNPSYINVQITTCQVICISSTFISPSLFPAYHMLITPYLGENCSVGSLSWSVLPSSSLSRACPLHVWAVRCFSRWVGEQNGRVNWHNLNFKLIIKLKHFKVAET